MMSITLMTKKRSSLNRNDGAACGYDRVSKNYALGGSISISITKGVYESSLMGIWDSTHDEKGLEQGWLQDRHGST
jgi:hypothetical protein